MLFVNLFLVCMTIGLSVADEAIPSGWEKGVPGSYKLVKVTANGKVTDVPEGYTLRLSKPEGDQGKVRLDLHIGNDLTGLIVKQGKDADGDLYVLENWFSTKMLNFGKLQEDEDLVFPATYSLKRVKFNEQFDELTIAAPGTTLLFKRSASE